MRFTNLSIVFVFFVASAGVTAFLMATFIHCELGVPPAALRFDALISAGFLGLLLVTAMTTIRKKD